MGRSTPRLNMEVGGRKCRACLRSSDADVQSRFRTVIDEVLGNVRPSDHRKASKNGHRIETVTFHVRGVALTGNSISVSSKNPATVEAVMSAIPTMLNQARQRLSLEV